MLDFIIKYWLEIGFASIIGIFSFLFKHLISKQKATNEKQKAIENGVQALLRNELVRRYREYETKGEITILDKENIEHMFKEYKNLGGNGTVAKMYEEILSLPIKIVR
ncbi:MAG: hypothetical protein IJO32_00685 [Bacilli bacterium]|nr:hypothetical protein [Bacilli bacterium]